MAAASERMMELATSVSAELLPRTIRWFQGKECGIQNMDKEDRQVLSDLMESNA